MALDLNNPDDRKKVADALVTLLNTAADLNAVDLEETENPFDDIGPSAALMNLKREMPELTHEQVQAWEQEIYTAAQNVNKFTGLVKVFKGVVNMAKGVIPIPL